MHPISTSLNHSAPRPWIRSLLLLPLLLGIALSGTVQAQSSADSSKTAGHFEPGRRKLGFGRLEGPPSPDFMRDSIRVTGKELQQYTQQYQSHMAATKPLRDSLRTSIETARAAYQNGDRSEVRSRRDALHTQAKRLAEQDKKFEDGLKKVLTKDEQGRYQQWKENRKQEARQLWREHRADRRQRFGHDSTSASGSSPSDSGRSQTR